MRDYCSMCAMTMNPEDCGDALGHGFCESCAAEALHWRDEWERGEEIPGGVSEMLDLICHHNRAADKSGHKIEL